MNSVDVDQNYLNWSATTDPTSGRIYFFNRVTHKTTWDVPTCLQNLMAEDRPWVEVKDVMSGKSYWYHKITKITTWENPYPPDETLIPEAHPAALERAVSDGISVDDETGHRRMFSGSIAIDEPDSTAPTELSDGMAEAKDQAAQNELNSSVATSPASVDGSTRSDEDDDGAESVDENKESKVETEFEARVRTASTLADESARAMQALHGLEGCLNEAEPSDTKLEFASHRKGFWKRLLRIGQEQDEGQLLTFKRTLIKKALLKQNLDFDSEARQTFKNVMSYMGDRKSSKVPAEHAKKILRNMMTSPLSTIVLFRCFRECLSRHSRRMLHSHLQAMHWQS